ncbi:MAG: VOC family protein [Thaumarchaeota archaeon]|nr:VOC family protein [Nitrososphaerota archaeon]
MASVTKVSGITLRVVSMAKSLGFYRDVLKLRVLYGDESSSFSSLDVSGCYLNLERSDDVGDRWGRIILYCDDVDGMHAYLTSSGYDCTSPRDAQWGERYFHMKDPDGHEISFARSLK